MGDALGRAVEGWDPATVRARYGRLTDYQPWSDWKEGPIGTITDDTQMTMCVAECLTTNSFLDPEDLARRFVAWLPYGRGKGRTTTEAVIRLQQGEPWYRAGDDSSGSAPAMRVAPVGLLRWNDHARLHTEAVLSALPTHRQPMGVAGAVAMASATAWLIGRRPAELTAVELIAAIQAAIAGLEPGPLPERRDPSVRTTLHDRIGEIPDLVARDPDDVFARLYNGAYVLECLPAALYCFLHSPNDVEEMLLLAVNAGHDADTVAAMAGTLGGALGGVEALPKRLLGELEYRSELETLGHQLYALTMDGDSTALFATTHSEFGRAIPNSALVESDIPTRDADWGTIWPFALTFDGYTYWGSSTKSAEIANQWSEMYLTKRSLPDSLTELRTCLFFEQRRWRHFGYDPDPSDAETTGYIQALIDRIRDKVRASHVR